MSQLVLMVKARHTEIKMADSQTSYLRKLVEEASANLPEVTQRRMFGCDAFFARGSIYALIWKTGRIGLKVTDSLLFNELMSISGSQPWVAGEKTMSHWVLVPETFHDDQSLLNEWVHHAYDLASKDSNSKTTKKTSTKKSRKK